MENFQCRMHFQVNGTVGWRKLSQNNYSKVSGSKKQQNNEAQSVFVIPEVDVLGIFPAFWENANNMVTISHTKEIP